MELLETPSIIVMKTIMVGNFQREIEIMIAVHLATVQFTLVEHGGTTAVMIPT